MSAAYVKDVDHPEIVAIRLLEKNDQVLDTNFEGTREAESEEKSVPLLQGLKLCPKATFCLCHLVWP